MNIQVKRNWSALYNSITDGATLTGRNLIPFTKFDNVSTNYGITINGSDGNLTISGTATQQVDYKNNIWANRYFTLPAGTYYLNRGSVNGTYVRIYDHSTNSNLTTDSSTSFTLTTTTDVYLGILITNNKSFGDGFTYNIILSTSSTATYAPYVSRAISLPSAQTLAGIDDMQDRVYITKNTDDDYYSIKKDQVAYNNALADIPQWNQIAPLAQKSFTIAAGGNNFYKILNTNLVSGRKYLIIYKQVNTLTSALRNTLKYTDVTGSNSVYESGGSNHRLSANTYTWFFTSDRTERAYFEYWANYSSDDVQIDNFQFINLTAVFGQYNEPTTLNEFYSRLTQKEYFDTKVLASGLDYTQKHYYLYNTDSDVTWTGAATTTTLQSDYVMPNSLSGYNLIQTNTSQVNPIVIYPDHYLTYKGTDYSISLINGHKYLFRDDGVDQNLITASNNQSLSVVGGKDVLIDVTKAYGAGNEPTSWSDLYYFYPLARLNPLAYTEGSLVNYKGTGIRTVGFNAYDHSTGTARLIGGLQYQITGTYTSLSYVDDIGSEETITPDGSGLFTPTNNGTLTVIGGNDTNTCAHLTWSGYRNGDFENYWSNVLNLPITSIQKHATKTYIVGNNPYASDWLSLSDEGEPLTPATNTAYKVMTTGDYYDKTYFYNGTTYEEDTTGRNLAFPDGMKSAGSVYDEVRSDRAILRIGVRSYQSGDESDSSVLTDKIVTYYELTTPIVITFDDDPITGSANITSSIDMTYKVADFGTEESLPQLDSFPLPTYIVGSTALASDWLSLTDGGTVLTPVDGQSYQIFSVEGDYYATVVTWDETNSTYVVDPSAPSNPIIYAPLVASIAYSTDFTRQIATMNKNYQSQASMDNLLNVLSSHLGVTITANWDSENGCWNYSITE